MAVLVSVFHRLSAMVFFTRIGLRTLFLSNKHLDILQDLLKKYVPNAEVWAYGSRVTGYAHEGSDLDLVLRNRADLSKNIDGWSDLIEGIQI